MIVCRENRENPPVPLSDSLKKVAEIAPYARGFIGLPRMFPTASVVFPYEYEVDDIGIGRSIHPKVGLSELFLGRRR